MEENKNDFNQKRNRRSDAISILIMIFLAVFCIGSLINHSSDAEKSRLQISALEEEISQLERAQASLESEISSLEKTNSYSSVLKTNSSSQSNTSPAGNSGGRTIYATPTGEKYHYASPCGRGTYYECTWDEVEERGLEPCKKCVLRLPQE